MKIKIECESDHEKFVDLVICESWIDDSLDVSNCYIQMLTLYIKCLLRYNKTLTELTQQKVKNLCLPFAGLNTRYILVTTVPHSLSIASSNVLIINDIDFSPTTDARRALSVNRNLEKWKVNGFYDYCFKNIFIDEKFLTLIMLIIHVKNIGRYFHSYLFAQYCCSILIKWYNYFIWNWKNKNIHTK